MATHKLHFDFSKNDGLTVKTEYRERDASVKINFMYRHTGTVSAEMEKDFDTIALSNRKKSAIIDLRVLGMKQVVDVIGHVVFFQRFISADSANPRGYMHFTIRTDKWNIRYDNSMLRKYKLENILAEELED